MEFSIMQLSLGIMLFVILVVMIIFFYVLIRFRKRKDDDSIPEQVEGNMKLEILWTVIPIILLTILTVPMVYQVFVLAEATPKAHEKKAITINVTAHQYWWEFNYPDKKITTASDLYVPTGTKVYIKLTSKDVIHSFWAPALFGKMDANPGLTNRMYFSVDKPGIYKGECAELCGPSHALMDFKVVAVSPSKFKKWESQMKKGAVAPQNALAKQGEQLFKSKSCIQCHAIGEKQTSTYPNLTNIGDRTTIGSILPNNKKDLKAWISDAPSIKADIKMPNFSKGKNKLTKQQVNALAEYLSEQKRGIKLPAKPSSSRS